MVSHQPEKVSRHSDSDMRLAAASLPGMLATNASMPRTELTMVRPIIVTLRHSDRSSCCGIRMFLYLISSTMRSQFSGVASSDNADDLSSSCLVLVLVADSTQALVRMCRHCCQASGLELATVWYRQSRPVVHQRTSAAWSNAGLSTIRCRAAASVPATATAMQNRRTCIQRTAWTT